MDNDELVLIRNLQERHWRCDAVLRRQPAAPLVSGHTMKSMTEEPRKPPRFFTIEQVAEELSVGTPLVRGMLRTGELRGIQVGGRGVWRIGIADVDSYIEQAYRRTAEKIARGDFNDDEAAADGPS
jgi:excisionase family DNA binding protein